MFLRLRKVLKRFCREDRGNVFILFGASAIPLFLFMGGAVDYTRHARYKTDLANAVDASALALARQGSDLSEAEATLFVENFVESFPMGDSFFSVTGFDVKKLENMEGGTKKKGYRVSATGTVDAVFLPIGNLGSGFGSTLDAVMDVSVAAEVTTGSQRLELVFVFDNTGSMNCGDVAVGNCVLNWSNPGPSSRLAALKSAARTLVDSLMNEDSDDDRVKIALVPFEGDVNVGPGVVSQAYAGNAPSWLDWDKRSRAKYGGRNFDKFNFATNTGCTTGPDCWLVGHKWLFDKLTAKDANVKWAGCVEMRAEPYDLLDTPPDPLDANTLFVPRFWPDEPDSNNDDGDSYDNNYLSDKMSGSAPLTQKSLAKYTSGTLAWHSGRKDTTYPFEYGPNKGCPRPIVALTTSKSDIDSAIDSMIAYYSTGTFIPTGLAWGWHVISPGVPFTQGVAEGDKEYENTLKAIVLFTDGENVVTGTNNHNGSRFSGYNYTGLSVDGGHRLGSANAATAVGNLDDKTAELCENVKRNGGGGDADDIRLYTITFGRMSAADEALMRNCASVNDDGNRLYFHAPRTGDLESIFERIGEDLSEIYLSM